MERFLSRLYLALVGIFLAAPIVVVTGVSFNAKQNLAFPPQGFSLHWFAEIFVSPEWFRRCRLGAAGRHLGGTGRHIACRSPGSCGGASPLGQMFQLLGAPFTLPPVITALGFLTFWATSGFYGQAWTAVIATPSSS
jgi:ABC-type spermidine/putrescine transport system, permease component II